MKLALVLFSFVAMAACTSAPVDEAHWKRSGNPDRTVSSEEQRPDNPPSYYYASPKQPF